MKVHYIQPFAIDKDIAKAYDESCKLIPDGDWICITDYDAMFLFHEQKQLVQKIAESGKADLYGAMTNRCNVPDFLVHGMFDNFHLKDHFHVAHQCLKVHSDTVKKTQSVIPGYFMLFSKKTWNEVRGFEMPENAVNYAFDQYFSMKIKRKAIIKGLYVLHSYRIWSNFPQLEIDHLKNDT
jgi:hypothetical protein